MSKAYQVNNNIPLTEATPSALEAADTNHIASSDATLAPSRSMSLTDKDVKHSKALSDATSTHSKSFPLAAIHELILLFQAYMSSTKATHLLQYPPPATQQTQLPSRSHPVDSGFSSSAFAFVFSFLHWIN